MSRVLVDSSSHTAPSGDVSTTTVARALHAEQYDLSSDYETLGRRLLAELSTRRKRDLRAIWRDRDHKRLFGFPRTAREAHLLFSHDRDRIIGSFQWVLSQRPFEGPILDCGCGTGTLVRLIAGLESDINLVGIDRAQNLIEIGSTLSSSLGNVTLVTADHTNYAAEVRYGTIVSICGLTFDYPAEFDEEFPDPTSGSPAWRLDHIQSVARRSLQQWRRKVKDGGALLSLERLPTRDDIAAFIAEAAQIGFIIDFERSTYLHCGEERFPAMRFVAGQPSEIDLGPLASWSWKA